jgi:putative chitinase
MKTLQEGDQGADVRRLQKRLKEVGFDPGIADGEFGAGTASALRAFQASEGLLPDAVAGKKLAKQLAPGQTVRIQVKNADDVVSPVFTFTRPR